VKGRYRFSRKDWVGDGVVTLVLSAIVAVAVFLPWANENSGHQVNFGLTKPAAISGALATSWGLPVLALAVVAAVVGIVMIARRPIKLSFAPCLAVSLAGVAITLMCFSAGHSIWDPMRPGLGLFLATLCGVLLVPTGIASAMVAHILVTPGAFGGRAEGRVDFGARDAHAAPDSPQE
jgi:hypothetical protein